MNISFRYISVWTKEECRGAFKRPEWRIGKPVEPQELHDLKQSIMNSIFTFGNEPSTHQEGDRDEIVTSLSVGDVVRAFFNDQNYSGIMVFKVLDIGFEILRSSVMRKIKF